MKLTCAIMTNAEKPQLNSINSKQFVYFYQCAFLDLTIILNVTVTWYIHL